MRKINQVCLGLFCAFVLTVGVFGVSLKYDTAYGGDLTDINVHETTPTRALMQIISSHTSKILDAILIGDFHAVIDETNKVSKISRNLTNMFFPEGAEGREFKVEGGEKSKKITKKEFEKYVTMVTESTEKIAESSKTENIVEAYNSFDKMLRDACFACHTVSRIDWPDFMKAAGG
ncbi:MAG: hypothetical protein MRK01_08450 [Candidatus Scalindua sp.]|nr:hypothetical protein [Candidatus Scalindua sp.]